MDERCTVTIDRGEQRLLENLTGIRKTRAFLRGTMWAIMTEYHAHPVLGIRRAGRVFPVLDYKPASQVTGYESEPVAIDLPFRSVDGHTYHDRIGLYLRWRLWSLRSTPGGAKRGSYDTKPFDIKHQDCPANLPEAVMEKHVLAP